jgi:hypothetical protein
LKIWSNNLRFPSAAQPEISRVVIHHSSSSACLFFRNSWLTELFVLYIYIYLLVRADQKDAYFINALFDQIEPLLRAAKGTDIKKKKKHCSLCTLVTGLAFWHLIFPQKIGSRWVNNNVTRLHDASKLIYLSLTTLPGPFLFLVWTCFDVWEKYILYRSLRTRSFCPGSQTLGEEYCDIVQFDAFSNTLPALYVSHVFF